jgi:hypothetical protein
MSEIQPETNVPVREGTGSLGELLAEMDEIYGPVPQYLLDWAERKWQELEEE